MDELISKQAAIEEFVKHCYPVRYGYNSVESGMTLTGIKQVLNEMPTAQPELCEDAVSRETLVNFIKNASVWVTYKKGDSEDEAEFAENIIKQTKQAIISMIEFDLPPVTPKQRTGKWIPSDSQCGIQCSVCGVPVDDFCHSIDYIDLDYEPNFCPNCGEKME